MVQSHKMERFSTILILLAFLAVSGFAPTAVSQEKTTQKKTAKSTDAKKDSASKSKTKGAESKKTETPAAPQKETAPEKKQNEELEKVKAAVKKVDKSKLSPDEQADYIELNSIVEKSFPAETEAFVKDVQMVIDRAYKEREKQILERYGKEIEKKEKEEETQRTWAIGSFEEFLKKYPNDSFYTPDVLYRLSELYYEKARFDLRKAAEEYDRQMKLYEEGKMAAPPIEPPSEPDYSRIVAIYNQLLTQFPDYVNTDQVMFRQAELLMEMKEFTKAREVYQKILVDPRFQNTNLMPQVWDLYGDTFLQESYNVSGEEQINYLIDKGISAFQNVLKYPDYISTDLVLFKLAWLYYRLDRFPEAVVNFVKVLDIYVKKMEGQPKTEQDRIKQEGVWNDAIEQLAFSYYNVERWKEGGVNNCRAYFKSIGGRIYERDIYMKMARMFRDYQEYPEAINAYRVAIETDPNYKDNPLIQKEIIDTYDEKSDDSGWTAAQEEMARNYAEGTPWYETNKNNPRALKKAAELVEDALYSTGAWYHKLATDAAAQNDEQKAKENYRIAAVYYGKYLQVYPHSKMSYETNYYYADTLFMADDFETAASEFEKVRDSPAGKKYRALAADRAVRAYSAAVEEAIKNSRLQKPVFKEFKGLEGDPKINPEPIPDLIQKLINAGVKYLTIPLEGEDPETVEARKQAESTAPLAMYVAAQYYYMYDHHDEARDACIAIIEKYPKHEFATVALKLLINIYSAAHDWDNLRKWAEYKIAHGVGDQAEARLIVNDAIFYKAEELYKKKKYEESAKEYLLILEKDPNYVNADKALMNAALTYKEIDKYETALKLFEKLYKEYPKSPNADIALWNVAWSAEKSYSFEKAISSYRKLANEYKDSKHRKEALFRAAVNQEFVQDYKGAASAYLEFFDGFKDDEQLAPTAFYYAANDYVKLNDDAKALATFSRFIDHYKNDPKQNSLIVRAYFEISRIYKKSKKPQDQKLAVDTCTKVMREFEERKIEPKMSPEAASSAAQCAFEEAEPFFEAFKNFKIDGRTVTSTLNKYIDDSIKQIEAEVKRRGGQFDQKKLRKDKKAMVQFIQTAQITYLAEQRKSAIDSFEKVKKYRSPEWYIAASYMIGYTERLTEEKMKKVEPPPELAGDQGAIEAFRMLFEKFSEPAKLKAIEYFRTAYKDAKDLNAINEWVARIEEALAHYLPEEFPLQKEAYPSLIARSISKEGFLDIKPKEAATEEKLKEDTEPEEKTIEKSEEIKSDSDVKEEKIGE